MPDTAIVLPTTATITLAETTTPVPSLLVDTTLVPVGITAPVEELVIIDPAVKLFFQKLALSNPVGLISTSLPATPPPMTSALPEFIVKAALGLALTL